MSDNDLEYYRRRVIEEDCKAASPENVPIRHVHEQLAALYRQRIGSGQESKA